MSVLIAAPPPEQFYTLQQAAEKYLFPSAHALRMYLVRHPEIVPVRYRTVNKRYGKGNERVLTESDMARLRAAIFKEPVK